MAKRKGNVSTPEVSFVLPQYSSRLLPKPTIPTGDARHVSHIREGRISGEVFAKRRLESLPLDHEVREQRDAQ